MLRMEESLIDLKNPPFFHSCSSHYGSITLVENPITYSNLMYLAAYPPTGDMDITTGKMVAGWPGAYQGTLSFHSGNDAGKNGVK